jgi:cytochrome c-type biogenesis protein CcmH
MVLEFWIPALGLLLAVTLVLLRALQIVPEGGEGIGADQRVYRDQLTEVERDIAKGSVSTEEGARMRAEVARRLLEADRSARQEASVPPPSARGPALGPVLGVVVLLLMAAGGYYFWLGAPGYPDLPMSERLARATEFYNARPTQESAEAQIGQADAQPQDPAEAALLLQLRAAVAQRPNDLQGHRLLASSEANLGNLAAARVAFQRAVVLMGDQAKPEDHAQLAELMIAAAGGIVTAAAEAELVTTLKADPRNGVARYYSGLMLAQVGRPDQAFALWRPLFEESEPQAPWYGPIRSQIESLAQAAGVDYALPAIKGPDAAAIAAASEMTAEDRQGMIEGMVAGLEERVLGEGGSASEWAQLVSALVVLGDSDRLSAALEAGQNALAGDETGLAALRAAAGVSP